MVFDVSISVETKIGRKRVIVIHKKIADAAGLREGQRVRMFVQGGKVVIEPIKDAIWLALHGRKIGRIMPEEVEEESLREQERLSK